MRHFTFKERVKVKDIIIDELKDIDSIVSIILVGSGAIGFTDDLSDLDFTIVLNDEKNLSDTMQKVKKIICSKFRCMNLLEIQNRGLQVYMLYDFLEIDMGFVSLEKLSALRERWKVIYDKTGKVDFIMKESWNINKNNHGKKNSVDLEEIYTNIAQDIWHYIMHSIVAVKRKNYWRAVGELDIVRNKVIELLGYKYSLETKRYRNVDEFPVEIKDKLQKTLLVEFNVESFRNSINILTDLIYGELESFCDKNDLKLNVIREDIEDYCKEILN